jgi:micrococcal nuclease
MKMTTILIGMVTFIVIVSFTLYGVGLYRSMGKEQAYVYSVVDGDTVWANAKSNEHTNIRVIGIDTPETKHPTKGVEFYGPEASKNAERKLLKRKVVLDYDGRKPKPDKYKRTLAYINIDGRDYGFWAIWDGYAREENYGHKHSKQTSYKIAEFCAKVRGVGVWSE